MLTEVFDIEKNIQCIEKNLLTFHKNDNDFSKAICNTVLHLAKKDSNKGFKKESTYLSEFKEQLNSIPIPEHFISLHNFCHKWGWPRTTVRNFLKKKKFPAYNHPSVSMYTLERVYEDKWFVDDKRLLQVISSLGETTNTRNRAVRNLDMMKKIDELKKKEQMLKERENEEKNNYTS